MESGIKEQRKHSRYDTEVKIYFHVPYDIKTKVKFKLVDGKKTSHKKYLALSKNVSAQGICFTSQKELRAGELLDLEVYPPGSPTPIAMRGEVRWSHPGLSSCEGKKYDTGALLTAIGDKPIEGTIYFDKENQVVWSAVLEALFGNFKTMAKKMRKPSA